MSEALATGVAHRSLTRLGRLAAPFAGLVLVLAIFGAMEPEIFFSFKNGQTIAVQTIVVGARRDRHVLRHHQWRH